MLNVITGASGHVGSALAHALVDRQGAAAVRALFHRKRGGAAGLGIEWIKADIQDAASLVAAFAGATTVFHLAAMISTDPRQADAMWNVNVAGTRTVVEAALRCGVRRLVHFSSIHAYDQHPLGEPLDETRAKADGPQHDAYDRTKAASETEVRHGIARGLDAVILNPTGVLGPYDSYPSYMGQFLTNLYRRKLPALVAGGFDWVDVRDVVAAALAAQRKGRCGENYILSGGWHSVHELAQISQQITGVAAPRILLPVALARMWAPVQIALDRSRGRRPLYTQAALNALESGNRQISNAKARQELGFDPRPVSESIRDAYEWMGKHDMLQ